jgi:hypothetical protein
LFSKEKRRSSPVQAAESVGRGAVPASEGAQPGTILAARARRNRIGANPLAAGKVVTEIAPAAKRGASFWTTCPRA